MVDSGGFVTEAGSSSFLRKGDTLFVRPVTQEILHGITRQTMLRVAVEAGITIVERTYKLDEVMAADEAYHFVFYFVLPVGKIDDKPIGNGKAGAFTLALRAGYLGKALNEFYDLKS